MKNESSFKDISDYTKKHGLPFFAHWEITSACNLECGHCFIDKTQNIFPTKTQALQIIGFLKDSGVLNVILSGGEPLLHPNFASIYIALKDAGMRISIFTNGVAISENVFALLEKYPPVAIEVSLYGVDEESYQSITGKKNVFHKLLDKIRRLSKTQNLVLKVPIMRGNIAHYEEYVALCSSLGIRCQFSEYIFPMLDGRKGNLFQRPDVESVVETEFSDIAALKAWKLKVSNRGFSERAYLRCSAGLNSIVINPDCSLSMCGMLRSFRFNFNNFQTFSSALNSVKETREKISSFYEEGACHQCKYANLCVGCPALSFLENANYFSCVGYMKNMIECKLRYSESA